MTCDGTGPPGAPAAADARDAGDTLEAREECRRAERYALDLLARRPRTVHELTRRLEARGYPERVVADISRRCVEAGYLDDQRFAQSWIEESMRSRPSGRRRVGAELRRKGVADEVVREALARLLPDEREAELARELGWRKAGGARSPDEAEKGKLWRFLRRRGFGTEACREAIRAVYGPIEGLDDAGPDDPGSAGDP